MQKSSYHKILRNVFSVTFGQAGSLLLNLISILLAARFLGVKIFGEFSYLIAIVGILSKAVDFGIGPILFREYSKSSRIKLLSTALFIRLLIFLSVLILYNFSAILAGFAQNEIILTNVLLFGIIFSSRFQNFRDLLSVPFKVNLSMHFPMILNLMDNSLFLIWVLLMPVVGGGLEYFIIGYVITNIPGFIILFYIICKRYNFRFEIDYSNIKWLLKESLPLFGFVILLVIYQQFDVILLKYFDGTYAAGIYGSALRITMPLSIIPSAIVSTIFPMIVKNIVSNNESNRRIISIVYKILFMISVSISVIFTFKCTAVIKLLFGTAYLDSVVPSVILLSAQIFLFSNFFSLDLLTAYNKQKFNFYYAVLLVVINTTLTLILIPHYSFVAPSIAKIISSFAGFILLFFYLNHLDIKLSLKVNSFIWIAVFPVSIYLISGISLIYYIVFSVIILLVLTIVVKYFSKSEIIIILRLLNKEKYSEKFLKFYK